MNDSEYTITLHVRKPGRVHDPAFNMTLQCRHCCTAWFKLVNGKFHGLPVECVYCGTIMDVYELFHTIDQSELGLKK